MDAVVIFAVIGGAVVGFLGGVAVTSFDAARRLGEIRKELANLGNQG